MPETLREKVKRLLGETDVSYAVISEKSGVPYGAVYNFATKGDDMKSANMEKLYEYLTGKPLIDDQHEG